MEQGLVVDVDPDAYGHRDPQVFLEDELLKGEDVELVLSGHRIILRADDVGVITGYILEG